MASKEQQAIAQAELLSLDGNLRQQLERHQNFRV
jgi:hypothetical protein